MPLPKKRGKKAVKGLIAGRYRVERLLGSGGGGAVYLVQDSLLKDKKLALKMVEAKRGEDSSLADLKNEFSTLSLLKHPNLASVYDFGFTEKEMFFTSEWLEGKDILEATADADFNTIFDLMVQTLRAVDFIHRRGVLHLDLKPANILVTDPDAAGALTVKLIDFGIAQWKKYGAIQSEGFHGTPPYAAPEIIQEREPTPASDFYSLGMIFHLIFAKRFPFSTQNPFEIMMRQSYEDPQRLGKIHPALPESFSDVLHAMVARDPAQRFQSPSKVLEAINRSLDERFTLRSPKAPIHILKETDHFFQGELIDRWVEKFASKQACRLWLYGAPGSGASSLLARVKVLLQLKGIRSFYFQDWREALKFLERKDFEGRPLFLDGADLPPKDSSFWEKILAYPSGVALLAANPPSEMQAQAWTIQELNSLSSEQLESFFSAEIPSLPEESLRGILQSEIPWVPGRLEKLLQAWREEGLLFWGESGWQWQGAADSDPGRILEKQEKRWEERRQKIREVLGNSPIPLSAKVLEGILGLEPGALEEALIRWSGEDWLERRGQDQDSLYSLRNTAASPEPSLLGQNLEGLSLQLKELYEQGKFSAGRFWVEALLGKNPSLQSPELAVHAARLMVAEGFAARALAILESGIPKGGEALGLYHEVRARACFDLGDREAAQAALAEAEAAYGRVNDASGLARAENLRGTMAKSQGRFDLAQTYYQKAVELASSARDDYCAGIALTNLALAYQEQGEIDASFSSYQGAWELSKKCRHPLLTQVLYHNWINLLHHSGKSSEAEAACFEWLNLAIANRYREQQALALNYLSLFAAQKNHRDLQASYLNQAIALLDPQKSPMVLAQFLVNRAYLAWSLKNFIPAQLDAERALQLCRNRSGNPLLSWVYLILGKVACDRAEPDLKEADVFFSRAKEIVEQTHNTQVLWELEYNRGLLEKARGNWEAARNFFLAAQAALEGQFKKTPEALRLSFLRDRKWDRVTQELDFLAAMKK